MKVLREKKKKKTVEGRSVGRSGSPPRAFNILYYFFGFSSPAVVVNTIYTRMHIMNHAQYTLFFKRNLKSVIPKFTKRIQ